MGADKILFESLDEAETWSWQNRGLPNVSITCIHLSRDWEEILVATFEYELFTVPAMAVNVMLVASNPREVLYTATVFYRSRTSARTVGEFWYTVDCM